MEAPIRVRGRDLFSAALCHSQKSSRGGAIPAQGGAKGQAQWHASSGSEFGADRIYSGVDLASGGSVFGQPGFTIVPMPLASRVGLQALEEFVGSGARS